jgi:hypothetical protein
LSRILLPDNFCNSEALVCGLTAEMISKGVGYAHNILDVLDASLLERKSPRMSGLVELANFSSIIGNLLATGIVEASNGVFLRAGPHKYQDLRASGSNPEAQNIEIKVALEKNTPKGHLAKVGYYMTCRYVLSDAEGDYKPGDRGEVVWIWELRFGHLEEKHFGLSNTSGDSGKTAVVNSAGMDQLRIIYFDPKRCPYANVDRFMKRNGLLTTGALPDVEE